MVTPPFILFLFPWIIISSFLLVVKTPHLFKPSIIASNLSLSLCLNSDRPRNTLLPVAVAAALATQDIFDKEDIFKRAKEMSPYFQNGLHSLKDLKDIVSIRGYGMMGGIEMKMKEKPGKSGFQTFKHCYDAGVNFKNTGDTLIIAPQFICEKKHIDEIIDKLRTGISNYTKS